MGSGGMTEPDGSGGCSAVMDSCTSASRRSAMVDVECSTRAAFCRWPLRTWY